MKTLSKKIISLFLAFTMVFSLSATAFAADFSTSQTNDIYSQEEIDNIKQAFLSLSDSEQLIFISSLRDATPAEIAFFETYLEPEMPSIPMTPRSAATATLPQNMLNIISNLMRQLSDMGLPTSVLTALRIVATGIGIDIADGPLPPGKIIALAGSAALATSIALNWKTVAPKMDKITRLFQNAFSQASSSISSAFAKVKADAKKEADANEKKEQEKNKKESEKRINDVLRGKKKNRKTKGNTNIYEGQGGLSSAEKDFKNLSKGKPTKKSGGTTVGELPDGTRINYRNNSSDGRPTLEIQGKGSRHIKIRYN